MPQKLNYLGIPVYMGGRNFYIPSLSYQDYRRHHAFLSGTHELDGPNLLQYFDTLIPIIGLAIRRNYPEVTDEQLSELLDMTTLQLAIKALQSASGMTPVSEGE